MAIYHFSAKVVSRANGSSAIASAAYRAAERLTDDDRATLYGAMLDLAARAEDVDGANALALWKRRGKRALK